jgi:uncharacterized protein (DUF2235 family)
MAKRIILLLDGTWNDADVGPFDTNIVRLREIIALSLDSSSSVTRSDSPAAGNCVLDPDLADETSIAQKLIAEAKQKVST